VFIVKKIVVDYKYHLRYYVVKNSSRNYIYSLSGFVTPPIYVYRLNNDSEFYAMLKPRTVFSLTGSLANGIKEVNFNKKSDKKLIYGPSNTHCRSTREESSIITVTMKIMNSQLCWGGRPQRGNRESLQHAVPDRCIHVCSDYRSRTSNVQEIGTASPRPRTRTQENRGRHIQLAPEDLE